MLVQTIKASTLGTQTGQVQNSEQIIKQTFSDIPILIKISYCESHFTQTNQDGSVFRGKENKKDVGAFQINEGYHLKTSQALGLNIYTLQGNMAYARYLYTHFGTQPWDWSKGCWSNTYSDR